MKIIIEVDDDKIFPLVERLLNKLRMDPRPILVPTKDNISDFNKTDPVVVEVEKPVWGAGFEHAPKVPTCMDEAGAPTKFKNRCSICNEVGRNSRSHRNTMRDGTYHWVLRPGESEEE